MRNIHWNCTWLLTLGSLVACAPLSTRLPDATPLVLPAGTPANSAQACSAISGLTLPGTTRVLQAVFEAATPQAQAHCRVDGDIDARTGADGQAYATRFRLRLPLDWNGRFYMGGGGGTNGNLVDPLPILARGFATVGTDGGHDNARNSVPQAGGTAAFGLDPQAREAFAYLAYDQVTRVGKILTQTYYARAPQRAYFQGCSEGGREALLMAQRFPHHYDGIIAGAPTLHLPLGPMAGIHTTQLFAGLARRQGRLLPNGDPAIGLSFSDAQLLRMRRAILQACDALDGLQDGMVESLGACTTERVLPELHAAQCAPGQSTADCVSADQVDTLVQAFAGVRDSQGRPLYSDWPWDPGLSGQSARDGSYNTAWRSWWLGTGGGQQNNAIKLSYVSAISVLYTSHPVRPFTAADALPFSLRYNFDRDVARIYDVAEPGAGPHYARSAADLFFTQATDLSAMRGRGGKLMVYHGGADSAISLNDTLRWYQGVQRAMGPTTTDFARMFVVPGMNHCRGGPATDGFDMLPQLMDWVERGIAPDSVTAFATHPAYFGVPQRSRPLCPYPRQARYQGKGDINLAENFRCE